MKLPRLRDIERLANIIPVVKDLLPTNDPADSSLLKLIKEQEDALYAKKNEICVLKEKIKQLEEAHIGKDIWSMRMDSITIISNLLWWTFSRCIV